ncbi:MAG: hypothetical protein F6J93_09275 [Oscillatoria sp. SIO1A7]|nr:hypothetical protein [Oscillatoria sp. SIO1A7]
MWEVWEVWEVWELSKTLPLSPLSPLSLSRVCFLDLTLLCIDPGRRGDSIPEIAYASKEDDCIGMRGPHKPMQPTDRAPARKIIKNIPL